MPKKTAVITGGSSGIGLATAELFARHNYTIVNLDISASQPCDISKPEQIEKAIAGLSCIDVLVCSAGVHLSANIENTSLEDFERVMDINLKGCFFTLKSILPYMRRQQYGSIVLVSSDQAFIGKKNSAIYGASKAAIAQLAKSTALDYAQYGIRVNSVCPGTIDTPLFRKAINFSEKIEKEEALQQPLGRIGKPEEVAELIYFLANPEKAGFITGSLYSIDGGYVAE